VCIDYTATKIYEVKAENAELAEEDALSQAREVAPYDELYITVGYVDQEDDDSEDDAEEEDSDDEDPR
jgi:hypothetical protein